METSTPLGVLDVVPIQNFFDCKFRMRLLNLWDVEIWVTQILTRCWEVQINSLLTAVAAVNRLVDATTRRVFVLDERTG